jgi:Zn-dependent protease
VLYALGHPASFAVLLVSFVVGMLLHGWVQGVVAVRMGDLAARHAHRNLPEPQVHIDPFGAVGALIGGLGWAHPIELPGRRHRGRAVAVALSGPAVNLVLGVGLLLLWRFALASGESSVAAALWANGNADLAGFGFVSVPATAGTALQHGLSFAGDAIGFAVLLAGVSQLYLGVLSLLPIPPLDGGRLLLALAPGTLGWQRARHYLVEQNLGMVLVLVMLVLPLGGRLLLLSVLDQVLAPLLRVVLGV